MAPAVEGDRGVGTGFPGRVHADLVCAGDLPRELCRLPPARMALGMANLRGDRSFARRGDDSASTDDAVELRSAFLKYATREVIGIPHFICLI